MALLRQNRATRVLLTRAPPRSWSRHAQASPQARHTIRSNVDASDATMDLSAGSLPAQRRHSPGIPKSVAPVRGPKADPDAGPT